MPRLGVLGTLVWDTIHGPDGGEAVEDWGGSAYSLAAWSAVAPAGWSLVPIVKVGADLSEPAGQFLGGVAGISSLEFVRSVPESNNRVSLFYHDRSRRCEKLTGGVPGWTPEEIERVALSCDALYVNFISGWELDLEAAQALRTRFDGPTWCDVHSLILGVGDGGVREPRPLQDRAAWLEAFDFVQVNEDEIDMLSPRGASRGDRMRGLLAEGPDGVFLTLGSAGAEWVVRPETRWQGRKGGATAGSAPVETIAPTGTTDPTGCGDVWGITCFASLLAGAGVAEAVRKANRLAAATAAGQGTTGLSARLTEVARAADSER
ncbi:MAG: carbohydrate kinase family protein [Gemmatimonadota bacterium]